MRITFLLPSDNLTGGNRVVATYAQQLIALGHEVLVVSCAPERLAPRAIIGALLKRDWRGLQNHHQPPAGHIRLSGVPQRVLEQPRAITAADVPDADIIIATWWETAVWMHAMPAAKGRKVHLIQGYEVWLGPQAIAQVHAALRLPNLKIAISSDLKRTIQDKVGPLAISVVPNAVDLEQFHASARQKQARPTVGYVYAQAAIKGADVCARACELARLQIPELQVVAFGADQPSSDVPLPAGAEFFYRPVQSELRQIYARCDNWLFGSRMDSFGLPILEAMACGTPVIAVPIGAAPDLLGDGTGVLVAPESAQEMAAAIVAMCRQTPGQWLASSARAQRKAHSYSWRDAAERMLELLQAG